MTFQLSIACLLALLCVIGFASCQQNGACKTCPCVGAMSGVPGTNGIPGQNGARGDKGERGSQGPIGPQGNEGQEGAKGQKGASGPIGQQGKPGPRGADVAAPGPISAANWKQCAWNNINDDRDSGKIKECSFKKIQDITALKITYQGNMRVIGDGKCNRWYFKFNGNECSGPMAIDAVIYGDWSSETPNILRHGSFEGYCENLPRGVINVELWVGSCVGQAQGDAYTGWNSVSRIMVEEMPRSQ